MTQLFCVILTQRYNDFFKPPNILRNFYTPPFANLIIVNKNKEICASWHSQKINYICYSNQTPKIMKLSTPVIIKGALALIMVLCLFDMPYGFYEFTRFAAFAGFGYLAYKRYDKESKDLSILYIILAVLFQPFFKLALGREIWNVVDVLVAIFLAYRVYANIKNKKE